MGTKAKKRTVLILLAAWCVAALFLPAPARAEEFREVALKFAELKNWADGGDGKEL